MKKNTHTVRNLVKPGLRRKPYNSHLVQFYKTTDNLIKPLAEFIGGGLRKGEICLIIATSQHADSLNMQLEASGIDVESAISSGRYRIFDAATVLAKFMVNGMPDREKFFEVVGGVVRRACAGGIHVRAYGEMVALLWKVGNKEAVFELESLWDQLAELYIFTLYCSYPELHFVMDKAAQVEIAGCHTASLPELAFS